MIIGPMPPESPICIDLNIIERLHEYKLFGVIFDDNILAVFSHIQNHGIRLRT